MRSAPGHDVVTLLVVDDDRVDVRALTRALRKRGVDNPIEVAGNGQDALDVLRGANGRPALSWPYVVLLDLNMPRMNGIEFLETLRKDAALSETVVFVLTTSDDDRDKVAAYRHHIAGYVVKTNTGAEFMNLVTMLKKFVITVRFPHRARVDAG